MIHPVRFLRSLALLLSPVLLAAFLGGCSEDPPSDPARTAHAGSLGLESTPPAELVTVADGTESLTFWPYTGPGLGTPSDPVNVILAGEVDPVQIRAALLALDGDRSSLGLPPVPPFDARWADAIGDVHTTYAEDGGGWSGSVVQLALGDYAPLRVHLRLFSTLRPSGEKWTLGAAHFEVLIPGTADHEVLSWEFAQAVVVGDLLRTGLVDPASIVPTDPIHAAPTFRAIRAPIYNGLPSELVMLLGGPPQPVAEDVPLPSDGRATFLRVVAPAPIEAGTTPYELVFEYGQIVPRPICQQGPLDYVEVVGPIRFVKEVTVGSDGSLRFTSNYSGRLTITPKDVTVDPPVTSGDPFDAVVNGNQAGEILGSAFSVVVHDRRLAPQEGGTGVLLTRLRVGSSGRNAWEVQSRCLEP